MLNHATNHTQSRCSTLVTNQIVSLLNQTLDLLNQKLGLLNTSFRILRLIINLTKFLINEKLFTYSFRFIVFNLNAQITVQFFDEAGEIPGVTIRNPNKNIFTQSYFDGNFSLEIMNSKISDLEFEYEGLIIKTENINLDKKDK